MESKKKIVLSLYRELIYYSKLITNKQDRINKTNLIRTTFRNNKSVDESEHDKINKLIEEGQKKLSFLKIMTPRENAKTYNISGVFKYHDGKCVQGNEEEKSKRMYKDEGIDIMDYRRHQHLVRRMNFLDRKG